MEVFIGIFLTIMIGSIIYSYYFSRKNIVKRKLKKAPHVPINDFRDDDIAKIKGAMQYVKDPLIAPLSGRACAHYRIVVEERRRSGKSSSWHTIIEEEQSSNFLIKEGSNYALLDDKNRKSYLVPDAKYDSGFLNDATPELEAFLNRHGHKSENLIGMNKSIRYREGVLEEGEEVAVTGTGRWMDATSFKLDLGIDKILVLVAPEGSEIYLSDDPSIT